MRRFITIPIASSIILISTLPCLQAQSPAPNAYTVTQVTRMTEASMFSGQESTLTVSRSGSQELVELTIAPWPANPKGVRFRYLFDFQAHKAYSLDMVENACSWMNYVSARAPVSYDPITAFDAEARAEMAKAKQHPVGTEVVSGIPAVIVETDSPDGKFRTWIAQKGDFPVKMTLQPKGGAASTMMEVKQVDFSPPAASLFVPPQNCATQTQGEWSDSGVSAHAEAKIEAQASASLDAGTGTTQAQVGAKTTPVPPSAGAAKAAGTNVGELVENGVAPSENSCTVLFRVVRAETMAPVTSGVEIRLNNRKVTEQYQNGTLRITNAAPQFSLQVDTSDGAGWGSDLSRQCFQPETVLLFAFTPGNLESHWYWVKPGK